MTLSDATPQLRKDKRPFIADADPVTSIRTPPSKAIQPFRSTATALPISPEGAPGREKETCAADVPLSVHLVKCHATRSQA